MIHHDARDYNTAVSEAAVAFKKKLEEMIHGSVTRVENVIQQVQNDVPDDALVLAPKLHFDLAGESDLVVDFAGRENTLHRHALNQVADRAGIVHMRSLVNDLASRRKAWATELIAHNLNEIYSRQEKEHYLLRAVNGQLRGFLSNSYRRLDSRPILDAFIGQVRKFGARPVDGFALETKLRVRAILPFVFEPFPGEIMAFGAELGDSEYGDGALSLKSFLLRMWCTNLATTEDVLTKVHLGKRMTDLRLSEATFALDTQTMQSAVNDLTSHVLSADAVNSNLDVIRRANDEKVEPKQIDAWIKKNLTKEEGDRAKEEFASADVELLPPGQTNWRWSNALSWLANETDNESRKLDLQEMAGSVLKKAA